MFRIWDRTPKQQAPGQDLSEQVVKPADMSRTAREALRSYTPARIGLETAGVSVATRPLLDFQLAHARARDAVHMAIDVRMLCDELRPCGLSPLLRKGRGG